MCVALCLTSEANKMVRSFVGVSLVVLVTVAGSVSAGPLTPATTPVADTYQQASVLCRVVEQKVGMKHESSDLTRQVLWDENMMYVSYSRYNEMYAPGPQYCSTMTNSYSYDQQYAKELLPEYFRSAEEINGMVGFPGTTLSISPDQSTITVSYSWSSSFSCEDTDCRYLDPNLIRHVSYGQSIRTYTIQPNGLYINTHESVNSVSYDVLRCGCPAPVP